MTTPKTTYFFNFVNMTNFTDLGSYKFHHYPPPRFQRIALRLEHTGPDEYLPVPILIFSKVLLLVLAVRDHSSHSPEKNANSIFWRAETTGSISPLADLTVADCLSSPLRAKVSPIRIIDTPAVGNLRFDMYSSKIWTLALAPLRRQLQFIVTTCF